LVVYGKLTILILCGALAVRIAAGLWWQQRLPQDQPFAFPDSWAYWQLAQRVADGEPYGLNPDRRVFRTPGYPLMLSALYLLAENQPPVIWTRFLNACLGTLAVGAVMGLARLLFDRSASLIAGGIAAVYPSAVSMSTFVLAEAPFCPLMVLHLILWMVAWRSPGVGRQFAWAVAGGSIAGLATLMRPSWLLFVPFSLAVGLAGSFVWPGRSGAAAGPSGNDDGLGHGAGPSAAAWGRAAPGARHVLIGLGMIVGLIAAMAPWWIRNWRVTGHFVPTTLQVGESLYDGLHPGATGASEMSFVDHFRRELRVRDALGQSPEIQTQTFEQRLDQRMRRAAVRWAREHPGRVAELAWIKLVRMWNVWPNEASLSNPLMRLVLCSTYVPVLLLALVGGWRFVGRGWPYVLCFLPAVYFTGLHVIFVGSIRYRQPAMLPLIAIAAGMLGELMRRFRIDREKSVRSHLPGTGPPGASHK
jgi:4-amino-4-deoxy-L-arabinose transferase-like glycosyltransferase